MERKEVFEILNKIFREVFDNADIELTDTTSAHDIEEWDSLAHVQLMAANTEGYGLGRRCKCQCRRDLVPLSDTFWP